jgi:hypothetical protein
MNISSRIIILFFIIIIYPAPPVFSDTIHLKNGKEITIEKYEIENNLIRIKEKNKLTGTEIPIEDVIKIVTKDGRTLSFNTKNIKSKKPKKKVLRNYRAGTVIWDKKLEGLLTPFPLSLNYTFSSGISDVSIYNRDESRVAKGEASFIQKKFSISTEEHGTDYFISPELGFFQRKVEVKDFSRKSRIAGDNIIPGVITDPLTGDPIPQEDVYSLKYKAEFNTIFLDLKAGLQLALYYDNFDLILNGYLFGNAVEYRKTKFYFNISNSTEEFTRPFGFSYLNSYGYGGGLGLFFNPIRTGISLSYEKRFLRRFELPAGIRFKESYYDSQYQTTRTRETTAEYSDITAHTFVFRVYFIL